MSDGLTNTFEMHLKPRRGYVVAAQLPTMIEEATRWQVFQDARVVPYKADADRILLINTWDREKDYRTYLALRASQRRDMSEIERSPPVMEVWPTTVLRT